MFLQVNSLECYQCVAQSLGECLSQATQTTCYSGLSKCGTVGVKYESGEISSEAFVKGLLLEGHFAMIFEHLNLTALIV